MKLKSMEESLVSDDSSVNAKEKLNKMKKGLTLDLNAARTSKKPKFYSPILSSPDLKMLKLASPELEKLIIQQNSFVTPTTTQIFFSRNNVTEEQEMFAKGFSDHLAELHNIANDTSCKSKSISDIPFNNNSVTRSVNNSPNTDGNRSCGYLGCSELVNSYAISNPYITQTVHIKEEPSINIVPSSPLSPIDMETQEKIKLERKRQRNRIAASKCRRRKLERIAKLEDKVRHLSGENSELMAVVNKFRQEVYCLKQEVAEHIQNGCDIPSTQNNQITF